MRLTIVIFISLMSFLYMSVGIYSKDKLAKDLIRVYFIDTYKGESIFIDIFGKKNVLIDTGGEIPISALVGKKRRANKTKGIIAFFNKHHIKKIDFLIISYIHPHYIGNLPLILEKLTVRNIMDLAYAYDYDLYAKSLKIIEKKKIPYTVISKDSPINVENVLFEIVSPNRQKHFGKPYENSLVMKMIYKDISFLFTGAIGKDTVDKLISLHADFTNSFLKLPYNYGAEGNLLELIKLIKPKALFVPSSKYNIYRGIIRDIKAYEFPVYSAFNNGTVLVKTDGKNYSIKDE